MQNSLIPCSTSQPDTCCLSKTTKNVDETGGNNQLAMDMTSLKTGHNVEGEFEEGSQGSVCMHTMYICFMELALMLTLKEG